MPWAEECQRVTEGVTSHGNADIAVVTTAVSQELHGTRLRMVAPLLPLTVSTLVLS